MGPCFCGLRVSGGLVLHLCIVCSFHIIILKELLESLVLRLRMMKWKNSQIQVALGVLGK